MNARDLLTLAKLSGLTATIEVDQTGNEYVCCSMTGYCVYKPAENDDQALKLLAAMMPLDDWDMFYDDGIDEFFIYRYDDSLKGKSLLSHSRYLNEAIVQAAQDYLERR